MSQIHVQFESLQNGAQGIHGSCAALRTTLDQLDQDLRPMIDTWSGSAQQAYLTCKAQWDGAALELAQLLDGIGRAVQQAHDNYRAAEDRARSTWS
jgi:WXG100 family type VII secretion target